MWAILAINGFDSHSHISHLDKKIEYNSVYSMYLFCSCMTIFRVRSIKKCFTDSSLEDLDHMKSRSEHNCSDFTFTHPGR